MHPELREDRWGAGRGHQGRRARHTVHRARASRWDGQDGVPKACEGPWMCRHPTGLWIALFHSLCFLLSPLRLGNQGSHSQGSFHACTRLSWEVLLPRAWREDPACVCVCSSVKTRAHPSSGHATWPCVLQALGPLSDAVPLEGAADTIILRSEPR